MSEIEKNLRITLRSTGAAFDEAIACGLLYVGGHDNKKENSMAHAGEVMYMGDWDGRAHFKNIVNREYISHPLKEDWGGEVRFAQDGDANFFTLFKDGNWLARIQWNGQLSEEHQRLLTAHIARCLQTPSK